MGRFLRPATALPQAVYGDFVEMLFSMRLPILGFGLVFVAVAGLIACEWHDAFIAALTIVTAVVMLARLATLGAYRRGPRPRDVAQLRRWERRYALGNYMFAILLGLLNVRALGYSYPLIHLITVSLVFSFGAGVVERTSMRPLICVASLLLATVPTIAALAAQAIRPSALPFHAELFAVEALLMAMVTALSLQTVAHLYRSAVEHHTARHDLARMARHDALTGLANRLLLRERFAATGRDALRSAPPLPPAAYPR